MKIQDILKITARWQVSTRIGRAKQEIIRDIQMREGYSPCFRTRPHCGNDCLWKSDCLKVDAKRGAAVSNAAPGDQERPSAKR